jgi:hypothetical protein
MKFSKKQLVIIAVVAILAIANVALAVLYMTRNVDISGGVSVIGDIEVYEDDGTTTLTSFDFPNFTGAIGEVKYLYFFVNNTGNVPVYVYWNISASSLVGWTPTASGYQYNESSVQKYAYYMQSSWSPSIDYWAPNDHSSPESLYLGVGEGNYCRVHHAYTGSPITDEVYTLTMSFYAEDA